MNKSLSCAKRRFLIGSLVLLILVFATSQADAGSYDPAMTTRYAGMIKPQNNLVDYEGRVNSYYSTAYLGNYYSGTEGSGSHPGVDIQDGDCAFTIVRAVAQGEIVQVISNWRDIYPGLDPCGNNSAIGGWGNLVVIKHDAAPSRGEFSGIAYTAYAHLWNISAGIAVGDKVLRGSVLGIQGSTGGSTGPHLHFQMDKEIAPNHPWWPIGLDVNSTSWQDQVRQNTFNPMLFVQGHLVSTNFDGIGAFAQYYDEQGNFAGSGYAPQIDYEWLSGHPGYPGIEGDDFSASWDGSILIPHPGYYSFYISVDDNINLWIDNNLILSDWTSIRQYPVTYDVRLYLFPGYHSIALQYRERTGNATVQLAWLGDPKINFPLILKTRV